MKQLRYRLLIMLAALMLLPTGVGAAEAQKDLKIQDVFTRYGKKRHVTIFSFYFNFSDKRRILFCHLHRFCHASRCSDVIVF